MTARVFFLSYSRRDVDAADHLAAELGRFGQDVWRDEELSGGQRWWDTILEQIRRCDCFVFAQSRASLESKACMSELEYAFALGKPILPIVVGETPPDQLLKRYLAEAQRVDAREPEKVTHALAKALFALSPAPPLPDPLPQSPAVPISYLDELTSKIGQSELSMSEQRNLLGDIKQQLAPDREPEAGRELLRLMRKRDDLYASVAADIDGVLGATPAARATAKEVAPSPPPIPVAAKSAQPAQFTNDQFANQANPPQNPTHNPSQPARRHPRWLVILAIIGGIVVALMILGALMQPECYFDQFNNYVCV